MNELYQSNITPMTENRYHRSITTLPLHAFISVVCEKHLSPLIIAGNPTVQELTEAWEDMRQEYSDAIGGGETDMHIELLKEVEVLSIKITILDTALEVLRKFPYQYMLDQLNWLLGTKYEMPEFKSSEYNTMLKKAKARGAAFRIDHDMKVMELAAIKEKFDAGEGEGYSREYFHRMLITLSDHAKYMIPDTITVFDYCERIKRFNIHINELKKLPKSDG